MQVLSAVSGLVDTFIDLRIDLARRIAVVLAQLCQILTEHSANFGWLIFFGPFPCSLCARPLGEGRQRVQGILVSVNSDGKIAERQRVAVANAALPITNDTADLIGNVKQGVGVCASLGLV